MDAQTAKRLSAKYPLGALMAEGKSKKIYRAEIDEGQGDTVIVRSKDDITAGDGAKHDVIPGKGRMSNQTTCNVFRLLKECGIPVAFVEQIDDTSFAAPKCKMYSYEVVVRREAVDDQKRVGTPAGAIAAGSTHLVIGRQITQAPDPVEALCRIEEEISSIAGTTAGASV